MKKIIIIILSVFLSSCGLFNPVVVPDIHAYQLSVANNNDENTNSLKCSDNNGDVLQVTHVKADAPFDTTTMYYANSQYELKAYGVHQWAALPNQMLTQAIQQKILNSCLYKSVVSDDFITVAHYRLTTQLVEQKQVISGNSSKMVLVIISQLVDNTTNKVVKGKKFDIEVPTTADANGYIAGANQATVEYLNQLLVWISNSK